MYSERVITGGIRELGNISTVVDGESKDILKRVNRLSKDAFRDTDLDIGVKDIAGLRPGREGEFRSEIGGVHTVHAYGFDCLGYQYSFGAA